MRRATLERLIAARRAGQALVRAQDMDSGDESLIDPATDTSPLGLAAAAALAADAARRVTIAGRDWFLTVYGPPPTLVIVGAVHIAQALAAMAVPAGYRVRVIDPRPLYAAAARFDGVAVDTRWPDDALAAEPLTARDSLVALAHDPKLDDPALAAALRSPIAYIGALGSARTHAKRRDRLAAQGFDATALARIHGPVGLAIGARTPAEIAIAILAEMVQSRRKPDFKSPPRIGGLVLAGGQSRRMGRNKLVAPLKGKPLLRHAVEAALRSRLDPVIVVTGHEADAVRTALAGLDVRFAHNPDYAEGMSTSLRRGIAALPGDCAGALVLLGDMPAIAPALIDRLIAAFDPGEGRGIVAASAEGQRGHPVLWGREFFAEMETLTGDTGARALLARHKVHDVAADDGAPLIDIDTQDALAAYES